MPQAPLSNERLNEIIATWESCERNTTQAADMLGVAHSTMRGYLAMWKHRSERLLNEEAATVGFPADDVSDYWVKTADGSYRVKRGGPASYEEKRDAIIEEMRKHAPKYKKIEHKAGGHLLVVDPSDVHLNKLSKVSETNHSYNLKIASERLRDGVSGLLAKAKPFGISKIVFVIGNDILNSDTPRGTTTSGTPQDNAGPWWEAFTEARKCLVAGIEQCALVADVHVIYCPSNHDWTAGFQLADAIYCWFHNHPNVHFGGDHRNVTIAHRKYVSYGRAVLGFTHGDGAKEKDLAALMQYEAREAWGRSNWGYWYCHHVHHKIRKAQGKQPQDMEKDHIGVTVANLGKELDPTSNVYVEYVRSPSPPDGWHNRNGYENVIAMEAFLHDFDGRQVARFTHHF
jgi:hypothetical protein